MTTLPIIVRLLTVLTIKGVTMNLHIKDFPEDLHKQAKIYAVTNDISLKELVIRALRDYLKKQKK